MSKYPSLGWLSIKSAAVVASVVMWVAVSVVAVGVTQSILGNEQPVRSRSFSPSGDAALIVIGEEQSCGGRELVLTVTQAIQTVSVGTSMIDIGAAMCPIFLRQRDRVGGVIDVRDDPDAGWGVMIVDETDGTYLMVTRSMRDARGPGPCTDAAVRALAVRP